MIIKLTGKIDKIWKDNHTKLWSFRVKTKGKINTIYSDFHNKPAYEIGSTVCAGEEIKFEE